MAVLDDTLWERLRLGAETRFSGFGHLMPFRVQQVLLVASLYDAYTLEEGGRLTELLLNEYRELNLSFAPHITRAASAADALRAIEARRYDLVITMTRIGEMPASVLAREIKRRLPETPVVALAFSPRELALLSEPENGRDFDRLFYWSGDVRTLLAVVKLSEDARNVAHDTREGGVRVILLVEDSVRFYSSYLPLLYTEVLRQTNALMQEGLNLSHKLLRMRARPKIMLARTFEEAWSLFELHKDYLLGVISDARFPRDGVADRGAGLELIRRIKNVDAHLPAVLQSSDTSLRGEAAARGAGFIDKDSRSLLHDLRDFMLDNFGFGDFVFRMPDGREVARARDLRSLVEMLKTVPAESLRQHASRDHFSNWLRARTEFALADRLRPRKVSEFAGTEDLRAYLVDTITRFRDETQRGVVADFSRRQFDASAGFLRIGSGSLGGKARGLAFMNAVLGLGGMSEGVTGVRVRVPPTAVVGTDVFDAFLDRDDLRQRVLGDVADDEVVRAFLDQKLPQEFLGDLRAFLRRVRYPLAVRSSSLLEDSQWQPFAGVYATYMLPNNHPRLGKRLDQLCDAIKLVYASTFSRAAKSYLEATGNRVEEEKMGVIIQEVVGRNHESYRYPDFAGVALSTNFYPTGGLRPEDGVAYVALGLGRTVVEGMRCLRFSPRQPQNLPQFGTVADMLRNSQREFFAVDISNPDSYPRAGEDSNLVRLSLEDAERHGTLAAVGSVYSAANDRIYDGIGRPGPRLVSFAHVLKSGLYPLAEVLEFLLELGRRSLNTAVEIEFAGLIGENGHPHELGFLQLRPLAAAQASARVEVDLLESPDALCATDAALGNGRIEEVRDIVYVPPDRFDRGRTVAIADEIGELNRQLRAEGRPYLLIGPGRWGSADRWLGIPVRWGQISGARTIVEADLEDFRVTPSQGTHFFQNLTSFQVGYLTVGAARPASRLDWAWLAAQPAHAETAHVRHLRLAGPLTILLDGRAGRAAILKPEAGRPGPSR